MMLHAVILAGGSRTRLWPLSRAHYPKQFLQLLGNRTLLRQTVLRLNEIVPAERVWIVTNKNEEFVVYSQISALSQGTTERAHILAEPASRNTAAAIGLAALAIRQEDPNAVIIVLPADHWIERQDVFKMLLLNATVLAEQGSLVTIGIIPDRPETGYGYIHRGASLSLASIAKVDSLKVYYVDKFVEKPDLPVAQDYFANKEYYWNAGIFLWRASTILEEIATHLPSLHQGLEEIAQSSNNNEKREVQTGSYLGEDDIIRFADLYQRTLLGRQDAKDFEKSSRGTL
jgi:mannose-1-phosphate guanylyltransferase/mannose-6-phosphate isomerase